MTKQATSASPRQSFFPSAEVLRSLADLADAVGRVSALEEIYAGALETLSRALRPDRAAVLLVDPDGVMRFKAWRGLSDAYRAAAEGHTPWSPDVRDPLPVLVPDVADDPSLAPLKNTIVGEGIRALAFIPLYSGGRLLGKFMLYYDLPHAFLEEELQLARTIASQVAFAIEQRQTAQTLRYQKALLEAQSEASPEGILVVAQDGGILSYNRRFVEIWEIPDYVVAMRSDEAALRAVEDQLVDPPGFYARVAYLYANPDEESHDEIELKDGRVIDRYSAPVNGADGRRYGRVWFFQDVSERKRAERELRAREETFRALHELAVSTGALLDPSVLARQVVEYARSLLGVDSASVYWWDEAAGLLQPITGQQAWGAAHNEPLRPGEGVSGRALQLRAPVVVEDYPRWEHATPYGRAMGVRSIAAVPLIVRDRVVGTVVIQSLRDRHFTAEQVRLLTLLAAQVGPALEAASSFAESEARRAEAEVAQHRLELLASASRKLGTTLELDETLSGIARLAVESLADMCVVELAQPDGSLERVTLAHKDPLKEQLARALVEHYPRSPARHRVSLRVFETGRSELLAEVSEQQLRDGVEDEEHFRLLSELGLGSLLVVPIETRSQRLGVLTFTVARPGRYTPEDLILAEELGRRCAQALDNARLYQEAREAVDLRDEFMSVAAHELKTPMTSLRGYAQLTLRKFRTGGVVEPATMQRALQVMDQQCERLSRLVSQLLDITRVESGQLDIDRRSLDLAVLLREAVERVSATSDGHTIVLNAPEHLPAEVDGSRLEQVIGNLLDNAIKYSPEGGAIEVELRDADAGLCTLSVRDRGIGIPPEQRPLIFDRLYRAHSREHRSGLGLGLYISRQIVQLHGGSIVSEHPEDGGTRFVVTLPRGLTPR